MSLSSRWIAPVPEETPAVARAAFPKGNPYMQMRDELGSLYTDILFVELYPKDGQPAVQPWRLALVTVMQFAENLTDRQAAEAIHDRIAWKYALSLRLSGRGLDSSVLGEFWQRLLDVMLEQFAARGWLKSRGKQRTDSTHILAAIRRLNQLELVHETLRHALNELAVEAPAWLKQRVNADWFEAYSQRTSHYLLPKKMRSPKLGLNGSDRMVCICCGRFISRVTIQNSPNCRRWRCCDRCGSSISTRTKAESVCGRSKTNPPLLASLLPPMILRRAVAPNAISLDWL